MNHLHKLAPLLGLGREMGFDERTFGRRHGVDPLVAYLLGGEEGRASASDRRYRRAARPLTTRRES